MPDQLRNVNLKDKLVFIHVPKCGGTSISSSLLRPGIADDEQHTAEHLNYGRYNSILSSTGESIDSFFVFSFVRNPYSRIYSHWKFLRDSYRRRHSLHLSNFSTHYELLYSLEEFSSFVDCVFRHRREHDLGVRSEKHVYLGYVFAPQIFWFDYNLDLLNFLGRFEKLEEDFKVLCNMLNVDTCLSCKNYTSSDNEYIRHFNSSTADKVNKMFSVDFDVLGYSFM